MKLFRRENVTVSITNFGATTTASLPRRFAKEFARAMLGAPKITSAWAPFRLGLIYLASILALLAVDITADSSSGWWQSGFYLAALVLGGVGFNYGQAALRANRRLELEKANQNATRTASGSGHYPPVGPLGAAGLSFSFATARNAARAGEGAELTESTADVPIIAFKAAVLVHANKAWRLQSTNEGLKHELDAEAVCTVHPPEPVDVTEYGGQRKLLGPQAHGPVPRVDCSCGFYALKSPEQIDSPLYVPLVVELSGRVIVHEQGYRAQYQRILSMDLRCRACPDPADHAWFSHEDFGSFLACERHPIRSFGPWTRVDVEDVVASLGIPVKQIEEAA